MLVLDNASGLYYDRESCSIFADKEGKTFIGSFNPDCSDAYLKLFLLSCINDDPVQRAKINKKLAIQEIHDLPYIISTPEYCYAYLLYKLRKLSGLNQEQMAFNIGMSKSTYNKIENRILSPSLNNLHLIQIVFGITPVEFAQLYWNIESIINSVGSFSIPSKISDFNTDKVLFEENTKRLGHEITTPIHLYDEKIPAQLLNKLEISFQEILLEGKKRNAIREEKQRLREADQLGSQPLWEDLSLEEQKNIIENQQFNN